MALCSLTGIKNKAERNLSKQPVSFEEAKLFLMILSMLTYDTDHLEGVDIMLVKGIKKGKLLSY